MQLADAEITVTAVEAELATYDVALEFVKAKQVEIAELEAAHQNNTADHSADFKTRLKAHSANSSALALHRADLLVLQRQADVQKAKVLEAGQLAIKALQGFRAQIYSDVEELAKAWVATRYPGKFCFPQLTRYYPLSRRIGVVYDLPRDPDRAIGKLRNLRTRVFDWCIRMADEVELRNAAHQQRKPVLEFTEPAGA